MTETIKNQGIPLPGCIDARSWKANLRTAEAARAIPRGHKSMVGTIHQIRALV